MLVVTLTAIGSVGCATVIGIDKDYRDQATGSSGGNSGATSGTDFLGTGGTQSQRGSGGAGGELAAGGATTNGGTSSNGSSGKSGGTLAMGGTQSTGGSANTGGAVATGGTKSTGGSANTGGLAATGGTKNTGGAVATGGAAAGASSTSLSPILGVQSAMVSLAADVSSQKVAISSIDPARSFLVFGAQFNSANSSYTEISGQISGATEVTFARTAASGAPAVPIRYYVAQFQTGVSVQRGSIALSSTSNTVSLGTAVDLTKSFPTVTYRNTGSSYGNDDTVRARLDSSTQLSLNIGLAAPNGIAEWQVVSFDGATVQTGNLTFATDATTLTTTLANAVDVSKTWLLISYELSGATGTAAEMLWSGHLSSSTQVSLQRSGGGAIGTITYYAVSFNNGTNVQKGTLSVSSASTATTASITTSADLQKTIAASGGQWLRGGTTTYTTANNLGYGTFTLEVPASTSLTLTRGASGGTSQANVDASVISFH